MPFKVYEPVHIVGGFSIIVLLEAWRNLSPKEIPIKLGKIRTHKYQIIKDLQQTEKHLFNFMKLSKKSRRLWHLS